MTNSKSLIEISDWDVKTIATFKNYLLSYENTPPSKLLLTSMIKFEDMYQPLKAGPFHVDFSGALDDRNEERAARKARIYLNRKDLIKVRGSVGNKSLVLTTRAHKIFYKEYPLARLRDEKWDGFWTIVTYDVPNTQRNDRNYLRSRLKDLGFGCPQESLYVCPLTLAGALHELVLGEKLENRVWVLRAQTVLGMENREVATAAWNLNDYNRLYTSLLEILPKVKKSGNNKLIAEWKKYFLALDFADPYLPRELLPEDWQGEKCREEFAKLGFFGLLKSIFGKRG